LAGFLLTATPARILRRVQAVRPSAATPKNASTAYSSTSMWHLLDNDAVQSNSPSDRPAGTQRTRLLPVINVDSDEARSTSATSPAQSCVSTGTRDDCGSAGRGGTAAAGI